MKRRVATTLMHKASSSTAFVSSCSYAPENMSSLPLITILSRHAEKVISRRALTLRSTEPSCGDRLLHFIRTPYWPSSVSMPLLQWNLRGNWELMLVV